MMLCRPLPFCCCCSVCGCWSIWWGTRWFRVWAFWACSGSAVGCVLLAVAHDVHPVGVCDPAIGKVIALRRRFLPATVQIGYLFLVYVIIIWFTRCQRVARLPRFKGKVIGGFRCGTLSSALLPSSLFVRFPSLSIPLVPYGLRFLIAFSF